MGRAVGEAVGRINGAYGEASWTPVRYINKAHSRTALAGLYRAARAGLVTPLRDGMNLVAREFVAAQNADDPGVLILSRFAGAAHECTAALLVNPYDPERCRHRHQPRAYRCRWTSGASAMRPISKSWCAMISATGPRVSSGCLRSRPAAPDAPARYALQAGVEPYAAALIRRTSGGTASSVSAAGSPRPAT